MSQNDRIISKLENHCSIIEYLKENYPQILSEWKNKNAVVTSHSSTEPVVQQAIPGVDQKSAVF